MHNWYYIETYEGKNWKRLSRYDIYLEFEDAVASAKKLAGNYQAVRILDECYGKIQWES